LLAWQVRERTLNDCHRKHTAFKLFSQGGNRIITPTDFVRTIRNKFALHLPVSVVKQWFDKIDTNGSGEIDLNVIIYSYTITSSNDPGFSCLFIFRSSALFSSRRMCFVKETPQ
jgi:Ca2+-binding EF-hand superfamily protein